MGLVIVACSCGGVGNRALIEYKIKHPNTPDSALPTLYVGQTKGRTLLETLPNPSEAYSFLSSVLKKRGRYSYLMEYTSDGSLTHVWNYQTDKQVR